MLTALGSSLAAQATPEALPFYEFALAPKAPVTMPNLVGLPQNEAEKVIRKLQVQQVQILSVEGGELGRVVRQMPESGRATRMAVLYVGTPPAPRPTKVAQVRPGKLKQKAEGLPAGALFALGQIVLLAFAWVAWVRIEEQARSRPLHGQVKGRGEC